MPPEFPLYTAQERSADRLVHIIGVPAALIAAICLIAGVVLRGGAASHITAAALYSGGLIGMLVASAGYNLTPPSRLKAILRRADHAMILGMIAGSYTPFALCALSPAHVIPLLAGAWLIALTGAILKVLLGNRYGPAFMALYLAHEWLILSLLRPVVASVPPGALVHARGRWPFHNAVWHAMVLVAAALHMGAIVQVLQAPSS